MKYLIVGLGNVGPEYELSRHNAGFLVLDRLAAREKVNFVPSKLASTAIFRHRGKSVHLIKPSTFMNLSGKAVNYWKHKLQIPLENLLIIVDDIALPFGKLRLRSSGSSAGHNGLTHIEQAIGTRDYCRLRMGIGSNFNKGEQIDYVLSRFDPGEIKTLDPILDEACEIIYSFILQGVNKTMSEFN